MNLGTLAQAMFEATDALMLDKPCICGKPHQPSTDCYLKVETNDDMCACRYHPPDAPSCICGCHDAARAGLVHIRPASNKVLVVSVGVDPKQAYADYLRAAPVSHCGQVGGSISLQHYRENPTGHVQTLPLCPACVQLAG